MGVVERFSYLTTVYASSDAGLIIIINTYQSGYALEILSVGGGHRIKVYKKAV